MRFHGIGAMLSLLLSLTVTRIPSAQVLRSVAINCRERNSKNVLPDNDERPALLILHHRRCYDCQSLIRYGRNISQDGGSTLRHIKLCRDKNQKSLTFASWMRGIFNVRIAILTVVCRVAESLDQLKKKKRITSTK